MQVAFSTWLVTIKTLRSSADIRGISLKSEGKLISGRECLIFCIREKDASTESPDTCPMRVLGAGVDGIPTGCTVLGPYLLIS